MPLTSLSSNPDRIPKNSLHRKNNSGELDVFEAARYFSSANVNHPGPPENGTLFSQAFENRRLQPGRKKPGYRLSLDMPINIALQDLQTPKENQKKSHKQTSSSPGSKLISTLMNSIFNQSGSKKKNKSKSGENIIGQCPGDQGRKRRSSMSHFGFPTRNTNYDSKPSDSNAKTPTKSSYKEYLLFRKFPVSRPGNSVSPGLTCEVDHEKDSRFGNVNFGVTSGRNKYPTATIWADEDDDGESDSSSDLFDLPIISNELDFSSSGLPVYGTTHMERISRVVV